MGLDFYKIKSKDNIDFNDEFIMLDDELWEYLYKNRDIKCIYEIAPYSNTELNSSKMKMIIDICNKIKMDGCLASYEDEEIKGINEKE